MRNRLCCCATGPQWGCGCMYVLGPFRTTSPTSLCMWNAFQLLNTECLSLSYAHTQAHKYPWWMGWAGQGRNWADLSCPQVSPSPSDKSSKGAGSRGFRRVKPFLLLCISFSKAGRADIRMTKVPMCMCVCVHTGPPQRKRGPLDSVIELCWEGWEERERMMRGGRGKWC